MDITIKSVHPIVQYTFFIFSLFHITFQIRSWGFCLHNLSSRVSIRAQAHAQLGNCSTLQSWGRVHYARSTLRLFWLEGSLFASVKLSYRCSHPWLQGIPWSVPTQMQEVGQENSLGTSSDQWSDQTSHQNFRAILTKLVVKMHECFE